MRASRLSGAGLLSVLTASSCGTPPSAPLNSEFARLGIIAILTAGDSVQFVEIRGFKRSLMDAVSFLDVSRSGESMSYAGHDSRDHRFFCPALSGGGAVGTLACHQFDASVEPLSRFRVTVSAPGTETVWGEAVVPGSFEVLTVELSEAGDLRVSWSPSDGASAYLVAVFDESECFLPISCTSFGTVRVADTVTSFSPDHRGWPRSILVRVTALERNVDAYLTSGVAGDVFGQLPASSVEGGVGVVGARAHATRTFRPG